jgi:hypothetical protein
MLERFGAGGNINPTEQLVPILCSSGSVGQ